MSFHPKDSEDNTGQISSQVTLTYTYFLLPGIMIAPLLYTSAE